MKLPIQVDRGGVRVEPNQTYSIPPRMDTVDSNGRLPLSELSLERVLSHPIDQFFRALAQDFPSSSIGIVLFGRGRDGSRGVVPISPAGVISIVRPPESCSLNSMPKNARQTGSVQRLLSPEQIGEQLESNVMQLESYFMSSGGTRRPMQSRHEAPFSELALRADLAPLAVGALHRFHELQDRHRLPSNHTSCRIAKISESARLS